MAGALMRSACQRMVERAVRRRQLPGFANRPERRHAVHWLPIDDLAQSLSAAARRGMPFVLFVRNQQAVIERIEQLMGFIGGDHQRRRKEQ